MGGIGIWQLLIVFGIIILLFGTKKLRNIGGDLGSAVKGFKNAMTDDASKKKEAAKIEDQKASKVATEDVKEKDQA